MPKKNLQQELQAKYIQYQLLKQQMQAYIEEKSLVDQRLQELNVTIDALHKIDDIKKGDEIWSTIGSGAFVRSDIKDIEKVLVALGAGVVSREPRERAIEIIQSRLEEMNTVNAEIINELTSISNQIKKLEPELEQLAHKAENE